MEEEDQYEQQSLIPKSEKELSKLREEIQDNPDDIAALEFLLQTRKQT